MTTRPTHVHQVLLRECTERIEMHFLKARRYGATDPIVLVLDLTDESARAIAATTGRDAESEAHIAQARRRGVGAVATWGLPRPMAVPLLAVDHRTISDVVAEPCSPDRYWVVVVTAGAAAAFSMPVVED
jgi:hypothetical protein